MKRFVCEQNIAHFQKLLGETSDPTLQRTLRSLLATAMRELAVLESMQSGAHSSPFQQHRRQVVNTSVIRQQFRADFDNSAHPYMLLDPGPGLQIIDINAAYAAVTFTNRADLVGKSLFEMFPDNPDEPLADGVSNLYASLNIVAQTGQPNTMAIQRYDVRKPGGGFVKRYWQSINTPIHDDEGRLIFLLHHAEDVTDQIPR